MVTNQDLAELAVKYAQAVKSRQERLLMLKRNSDRMLRWLLDNEDTQKRYNEEARATMSRGELQKTILMELGFDELVEIYGDRLVQEYGIDLEMLNDFIVDLI